MRSPLLFVLLACCGTESSPPSTPTIDAGVAPGGDSAGPDARAPLVACGELVTATPDSGAADVFVDATHVYWFEAGKRLRRAPLAGGPAQTLVETLPSAILRVEHDATHVYASDATALWRVAKAGGAREIVSVAPPVYGRFALDATRVYWVEPAARRSIISVDKATLAGRAEVAPPISKDFQLRASIAVDATHLYYFMTGGRYAYRVPKSGGTLYQPLGAGEAGEPRDVVVQGDRLFWSGELLTFAANIDTPNYGVAAAVAYDSAFELQLHDDWLYIANPYDGLYRFPARGTANTAGELVTDRIRGSYAIDDRGIFFRALTELPDGSLDFDTIRVTSHAGCE